jgi:hypothetical protein
LKNHILKPKSHSIILTGIFIWEVFSFSKPTFSKLESTFAALIEDNVRKTNLFDFTDTQIQFISFDLFKNKIELI